MPKRVANGPAIRDIRELAGMTQEHLAREIGISNAALSQIETGGGMKPANIKRAAGILGVPVPSLTVTAHTPAEVCAALHISREEFTRLITSGELATVGGVHVSDTALEEYIAGRLPEMAATP